jgi:hypothetical protein
MLQISTQREHIILFPLAASTYYLVVHVERTAPLMLVLIELERILAEVDETLPGNPTQKPVPSDDTPVLDAAELIEAVRDWLRSRSTK